MVRNKHMAWGGILLATVSLAGIGMRVAGFSTRTEVEMGKPVIRLAPGSGAAEATIEVVGLDSTSLSRLRQAQLAAREWAALLAVYPATSSRQDADDMPAMLGEYQITEDGIRFLPRYPLVAGLAYAVRFRAQQFRERYGAPPSPPSPHQAGETTIEGRVMIPKPTPSERTTIAQVYPTADHLPANQLKLYVTFSASMSVGDAYEHIRLFDAAGREVSKAFLWLEQELWDASRQRFTLLFDPGRIKRGLRANREEGAPLQEGKSYRLVLDGAWLDGEGNALGRAFEKTFVVTPPDRGTPDYRKWKIVPPSGVTVEPLRVTFDEPLDYALVEQMLAVLDERGLRVDGTIEVRANETEWIFTPKAAWQAGEYSLGVDTRLEDRAGNSLRQLFDVDLRQQSAKTSSREYVSLRFKIGETVRP